MEDTRVKLLLVDDRPENLLALEAILEPLGQTLISAHSGDEALKCVLQHDFAAILLDVQMPEMNGFDVAQIIKSREKSRYIPIIFLSAINK
ncbi:MAG: response regulator, partial [Thermoanaerobaculia bacterium]